MVAVPVLLPVMISAHRFPAPCEDSTAADVDIFTMAQSNRSRNLNYGNRGKEVLGC